MSCSVPVFHVHAYPSRVRFKGDLVLHSRSFEGVMKKFHPPVRKEKEEISHWSSRSLGHPERPFPWPEDLTSFRRLLIDLLPSSTLQVSGVLST